MAKWWTNILQPGTPKADGKAEVTAKEIEDAMLVTDAVIKQLSYKWGVNSEEWRMKLFPLILSWINE
jgi:hypothetical protein